MTDLNDLWKAWADDGQNNLKRHFKQSFHRAGIFHLGMPKNPRSLARKNAGRAWRVACRLKGVHPSRPFNIRYSVIEDI